MRTSSARTIGGPAAAVHTAAHATVGLRAIVLKGQRNLAVVLATLLLAATGIVFTPGGAAHADTLFLSGQVFASVGFSTVNVYDRGAQDPSSSLVDDTGELYTTGSAFDANDNFYVTDDSSGDVSEFSPTGTPMGQFATGLQNPLSLVFDNGGNLYVGQQTTPYVAEFTPSGTAAAGHRPDANRAVRRSTGSTFRATSAPSTTRPRAPTSCATTSAPTPSCRTSTSLRSADSPPSRSGSSPTATCSWRTPTACCSWTRTATSSRPTPARRCRIARASCSP